MPIPQPAALRSLLIGITTVVLITLGITVYCGARTGRFVPFTGIAESRKALLDLPLTIGDWVAEKEEILDSASIHQLEIDKGYVARRYKNAKTRSEVNFVMMLGPTGRVVVHTPEFCFGGKNYDKEENNNLIRLPIAAPAEKGPTEETFWKISFVNRALQGEKISFYYSVSDGSVWSAVDNPRYEFSRFLYVYKIQVEGIVGIGGADPAYAFLTDALPTIHQFMKPCR